MLNMKQFSRLRLSGLHLLMGALLLVAFGFSTAQAQQMTWLKGDTTYIPLAHTMSTVGDSMKYKLGDISLVEAAAGNVLAVTADSLQITGTANFILNKDSVVTITASSVGGLTFDTAGFFTAFGITQTSNKIIKVKAIYNVGSGNYISIKGPSAASAGTVDTISISGLYVQSTDTTGVDYDSTTTANVSFVQKNVALNTTSLSMLVALPGTATQIAYLTNNPVASQTAGKYINTTPTGTAAVDTALGLRLSFKDVKGNITGYGISAPSVVALLHSGTTAGNGTLSGTGTTAWVLGNHFIPMGISFNGLKYTKAEVIDLKFTFGSSTYNTITNTAAGLTFAPGAAANVSVALNTGKSDVITVDQTTSYTLTVTDAFFNPIVGQATSGTEKIAHGGAVSGTGVTDANGQLTAVVFTPSKFFVGADTLVFTAGAATQARAITINPGSVGGVIVDYAGTADGSAVTEQIAAGTTVYVRGFLRDTYGNPIDASSASAITFTNPGKNGKNTVLGTAALTSSISQPLYPNTSKTAVGVAVSYTVSTNVRGSADSVLATSGSYALMVTIQNRSNVPATFKFTTTSDSSVVASNYTNSITFTDTVWDAYKNLVNDPGTVTLAPKQSAYKLYLSTNGHTKFVRAADTTMADTLTLASGVITRTVSSSKVSGIDSVKIWSADGSVKGWSPVWVTPAAFAAVSLTPVKDTTAIAGQSETFTVEKLDAYGNHIDWGLSGAETRGTAPATTEPTAPQIVLDSTNVVFDTVSTGKNRGGFVTSSSSKVTGTAGVASVGGSLNFTSKFTAYTAGADTQKVYAALGGFKDTSIVYSMPTGALASFLAKISADDSTHDAGDSVAVVFTAQDAAGHRIYTYAVASQSIMLNHTAFTSITATDTTYYYSYNDKHNKYVKAAFGRTRALTDTIFVQGQATIYLHKFLVDSVNTVSITGGSFTATTSQGVKFSPLDPTLPGANGKWLVKVNADSLISTGAFNFTVTPRDKYYNINSTQQVIINVSSNQLSGFNVGSNPRVITGVSTFDGTLSNATGNLIIYVFSSDNSALYGTGSSVKIFTDVAGNENNVPKVYSLAQNYPNPFNPTTSIRYELPKAGVVTLKIYDILGKEVATLVNETQKAGRYSVQFNASALSSGVYFYRIKSNNFTSVKKLMLLK